MQSAVRILIAVVAGCLIALGLLTIALGQVFSGAWTLLLGLVGIVVALYERRRYGAARDPATEAPRLSSGTHPTSSPPPTCAPARLSALTPTMNWPLTTATVLR